MRDEAPRDVRLFTARRVVTMDLARPRARAFAVSRGRILAVGEFDDVAAVVPGGTPRVDLREFDVFPGLHDAHTHLSGGALERVGLDLRAATSSAEVGRAVRTGARGLPEGTWVRGFGWDDTRWAPGDRTTRGILDMAAGRRPVLLGRVDGHVAWANAAALEAVGGDPRETTGLLRDAAADAARRRVPLPDTTTLAAHVAAVLEEASRFGITSLEDVVEPWSLGVYERLLSNRRLPIRIGAWLPVHAEDEEAEALRRLHPPRHPWLSCGVRKVFLDGTLGSRTAALHHPYADDPETTGVLREDPERLATRLRSLAGDDWAIALHAVGDRATGIALDLLRGLPQAGAGRRHRIEHAQVVSPTDIDRLASSRAVVSLQPAQWVDDRRWLAARIGRGRDVWVHPWRRLVLAGVAVAFGSDWPVAPLDPRVALAAAVRGGRSWEESRHLSGPPAGREGELLDFEEALAAYTVGPARAAGDERRGALREGARGDFVAVRATGPGGTEDPEGWSVVATYVAGRRAWPDPEPAEV